MKIGVCVEPGFTPTGASASALALAAALDTSAVVLSCAAAAADVNDVLALAGAHGLARVICVPAPVFARPGPRVRAVALAALSARLSLDLVLTGDASADEGAGLMPAALAVARGVPLLPTADEVQAESPTHARAAAVLGGARQSLRFRLPAVVPITPGRRPPPLGAAAAVLEIVSLGELGVDLATPAAADEHLGGHLVQVRRSVETVDKIAPFIAAALRG